jgi:hypothetical protein
MSAIGQHIMFRAKDDRVIARSPAQRRAFARVMLAHGEEFGLFVFRQVDTHGHAGAGCSRADAGRFARRVQSALTQVLPVEGGFAPARYKDIADQRHLEHLFDYVLEQQNHHGAFVDPFHDASNLPDLLGLRTTGVYTAQQVHALLPRVTRGQLLRHFGVDDLDGRLVDFALLADAAAAAVGLSRLSPRCRVSAAARHAALHVAGDAVQVSAVGELLAIGTRHVTRLRAQQPSEALVGAVRGQLFLRQPGVLLSRGA